MLQTPHNYLSPTYLFSILWLYSASSSSDETWTSWPLLLLLNLLSFCIHFCPMPSIIPEYPLDLTLIINDSEIFLWLLLDVSLSLWSFHIVKINTQVLLLVCILFFQVERQVAETGSLPFLCILSLTSGIC